MAKYRKLSRTSDQRKALLRNQVTNLLYHGQIRTTEAKAKKQLVHGLEFVGCDLQGRQAIHKIFNLLIEESLLSHLEHFFAAVVGIEISDASLVEDYAFLLQLGVRAHHGVGVDAGLGRIVAHREQTVARAGLAALHSVHDLVGELDVYRFVFVEIHLRKR